MKHLIVLIALLLTTACETGKSGAEISALGESLVSTSDDSSTAIGPAIDYNKRSAANYANAVSTCQAESRSLCTLDQYTTAFTAGTIDYTVAAPGNYWMVSTTAAPGAGGGARNEFQATTLGANYLQIVTTLTRNYYCCL